MSQPSVFSVTYKVVLYLVDVVSDWYTGARHVIGRVLPADYDVKSANITETMCLELEDYSHPFWGGITLALPWAPAFVMVIFLCVVAERRDALGLVITIIFWPLVVPLNL